MAQAFIGRVEADIKCPHCQAKGQILLPSIFSIIPGYCPNCEGWLLFAFGHLFPLDKPIMDGENDQDVEDHIMEIITSYLRDEVRGMIQRRFEDEEQESSPDLPSPQQNQGPISKAEVEQFRSEPFRFDHRTFKRIFGSRAAEGGGGEG